ncbi:hypothetical protein A7975_17205 [Bacillus sp. FJAT-26390]|nr:hypothetical protein A7975_17205 [Bacillus sp. FJAT-26390]
MKGLTGENPSNFYFYPELLQITGAFPVNDEQAAASPSERLLFFMIVSEAVYLGRACTISWKKANKRNKFISSYKNEA